MSELPKKRLASDMDDGLQQAPAEQEEDPIKARAHCKIRAMISEIQSGKTYLNLNAPFIDAVTQAFRDDVAEEFFRVLGKSATRYLDIPVFDNNRAYMKGLVALLVLYPLFSISIFVSWTEKLLLRTLLPC